MFNLNIRMNRHFNKTQLQAVSYLFVYSCMTALNGDASNFEMNITQSNQNAKCKQN